MQEAAALLSLLQGEDGLSIHKACKKLGLSMSEMMRLLALLGDDASLGGLNLVEQRKDGARTLLCLNARGRGALAAALADSQGR
ncbi:hypothetical protein VVD49_03705 [Uliginosibacterium sp. H3]|uniref:Transcriptional regulator HTH-type FeoC domain-containing protein n=1 Tax=Uliginosibacterium silvisoli TaxID=3114758 RepID=A0ABU6K173_9RHOO|nr:hypothetical protein [Uliginosibacterium sp. H3]